MSTTKTSTMGTAIVRNVKDRCLAIMAILCLGAIMASTMVKTDPVVGKLIDARHLLAVSGIDRLIATCPRADTDRRLVA
jgi:hypothetical protein